MNGQGLAIVPERTRQNVPASGALFGVPLGVVHNLFGLYGLYCSNYLLVLITVPYLSRVLGPAAWGMVAAVQSFGGYLLLTVEFGFPLSATREAARLRGDRRALGELLSSVLCAKLFLSAAGLGIAALAWRFVPVLQSHTVLFVAGMFWAVAQGFNTIWFFQGLERMRTFVVIDLTAKGLGVIATFFVVHGPQDDWKVLALQGVGSSVSLLISLVLVSFEVGLSAPRLRLTRAALRSGLTTFVPRNASLLSTVGNAFLLSLFAPPNIVGFYAGADRLCRAITGLLSPASEAVYPRISQMARNSPDRARYLARLATVLVGAVALLMGAAIYVLAPFLVRALLGPGFEPSIPVLRIFAILPSAFALRNVLGIHWMLPLDLERQFNTIVLVTGAVNVVLAVLVAPRFGGVGVAWVLVGTQVAGSLATYLLLRWMGLDPLGAGVAHEAD